MMHYQENVTQIPSAAISIEAAEMLHRMYSDGEEVLIYLRMDAKNYPPVESRNTVAEIVGSELPQKVNFEILFGKIHFKFSYLLFISFTGCRR